MFAKRLFSSIVLWALLLSVIFYLPNSAPGQFASALVCCFVVMISLGEFYDMMKQAELRCLKIWGTAAGLLMVGGVWYFCVARREFTATFEVLFLTGLVVALFLQQIAERDNMSGAQTIGRTLLGILYIPLMFDFFPKIIFLYPEATIGRLFVFYLVVVTKFCDIGAYASGRVFGRHKMIPRISPNKTWEGFWGGLVVATVASVMAYQYLHDRIAGVGFGFADAIAVGLLLGAVGVLGDLAESMIKREMKVKDSGGVLPGIGGALDLIDSLLFTAPVMYGYLALMTKLR
ncbi:MAG: CDP-archaeol synthase [Verrucomicrobiae bacterium]|nr:CDP-archaeol synthase [Verrucomicrobiae bacterium]